MFILGLTGSIGMGKSATAKMFKDQGIPVHDADASVHQLMGVGGLATQKIAETFPSAVIKGCVDRQALGQIVFGNDAALKKLEGILHPLVRAEERKFLRLNQLHRAPLVVLDIPLLFETAGEERMDAVAVVSASKCLQKKRVLARSGMTEQKFQAILKKQMPDALKRKKADFIIHTGAGYRPARNQVKMIISTLKK
jgi:dephospho-CoA kinase